jgi:hypothetical protein
MMEEGIHVGCGGECLDVVECNCGRREVNACEACLKSDIALVCGACRDREQRVVPLSSYPCRDFQEAEAGPGRDLEGRLPVTAPVGAWGPAYRAGV